MSTEREGTVAWLRDLLTCFPDHAEVIIAIPGGYGPIRNAHWECVVSDPNSIVMTPEDGEECHDVKVLITNEPWEDEPPDQEHDPSIEGVGDPYNYDESATVHDLPDNFDPYMG